MLDSTIVRAHQHAADAKKGKVRGVRPFARRLEHDNPCCREWRVSASGVGDKGYDSDPLRQPIHRHGAKPVIPARKGMRRRHYDRVKYKLRNVVERFFNRIKHYRRVAIRYEKN